MRISHRTFTRLLALALQVETLLRKIGHSTAYIFQFVQIGINFAIQLEMLGPQLADYYNQFNIVK